MKPITKGIPIKKLSLWQKIKNVFNPPKAIDATPLGLRFANTGKSKKNLTGKSYNSKQYEYKMYPVLLDDLPTQIPLPVEVIKSINGAFGIEDYSNPLNYLIVKQYLDEKDIKVSMSYHDFIVKKDKIDNFMLFSNQIGLSMEKPAKIDSEVSLEKVLRYIDKDGAKVEITSSADMLNSYLKEFNYELCEYEYPSAERFFKWKEKYLNNLVEVK